MKIIQILTNLNWGDAIGNEVLAMDEALKQQGYDSRIMAITIHETLHDRASDVDISQINKEDLVIFHKATGDILTKSIANLPCKKVMVYHNITPAKYFLPYDRIMSFNLWLGRQQLHKYASKMDACWADSTFNAEELIRCGANKGDTKVLPILFSENESATTPDQETEEILKGTTSTKLLCIGRIAPNKKLEDAIKLYDNYRKTFDKDAVLYLVGNWEGLEKYYAKLKGFCSDLGLNDDQVVFTGHITEEEKEAYLLNVDVLICMSEHEGFCVPLIEAMRRELPILAYSAAAVPETLGDNQLLFGKKDYISMAKALESIQKEDMLRAKVLEAQQNSLKRFNRSIVLDHFLSLVNNLTTNSP